jgi:galactonate dehydratase
VRASIGNDVRLMVDCHWRLDMETTRRLVEAAAELNLHWIECPLPEEPATLEDIRALRSYANARGIKLAGCELMTRREGFAPFLSAGAYDVIMPDIKYVGGLKELLALAADARQAGVELSLHNPTGPVCHAVSLHVCSAIGSTDLLEMQFDESPLFEQLQAPRLPPIDRDAALTPNLPGIGLSLEGTVLTRAAERHWTCE